MKKFPLVLLAFASLAVASLAAPEQSAPSTNTPASSAANAEPAPANEGQKAKAKHGEFKDEHDFDPPAAATVKGPLNVRGQPNLKGEVIGHLHKDDSVSVLETMTTRKAKKGEPVNWARITLPASVAVWVFGDYVNTNSWTITARRINLRGGPGENYSVLGRLQKGAAVKEISRKNKWILIETPPGAYAFVDADYLNFQPAAPPVAAAEPAPTAPAPAAQPPVASAPTNAPETAAAATVPAAAEAPKPGPIVAPEPTVSTATPEPAPAAQAAEQATNSVARVITREGILRRAYNIQAPADYELRNPETGEVIDYIEPQPKQNLKSYVGAKVLVSGAEILDRRWPRTPVLELQTLDIAQ
jgi:uncharacterized protein YgiM (DUF1202 family)